MALEMVDRKIRFSWNTGGKLTGSLQHNLTLETNDKTYSANSKWYKIEVNRSVSSSIYRLHFNDDSSNTDANSSLDVLSGMATLRR